MRAQDADLQTVLLNPRFSVVQDKPDGSVKIRPIDNMSWSACPTLSANKGETQGTRKKARKEGSVNGYTWPAEKLRHDTLDALTRAKRAFVVLLNVTPGLIKVAGACTMLL